jgi:hypothetical protein
VVISYSEIEATANRTGSDNLQLGPRHSLTRYGGIVSGKDNVETGVARGRHWRCAWVG